MDDVEGIALALWRARCEGGVVAPPRLRSEADAYAVQDALIRLSGEAPAGWKVGATAPGVPEALGLPGPLAGPLWARWIHHGDDAAPASVALPPAHGAQAEVEFALRVGLRPGGAGPEPLAAVDAVALALEFTGSRLAPPTEPAGPGFVADHGGNGAAVLGPPIEGVDLATLATRPAELAVDGRVAARGGDRTGFGDPRAAFVWLVSHLAARGHALEAGQWVLTGAAAPLAAFPPGALIEGRAPSLPAVAARLRDGDPA